MITFKKLPSEIFAPIVSEVEEISNDFSTATSYNYKLAGHINKEFELKKSVQGLQSYLPKLCGQTEETMELTDVWVNYQKKHEFNPLHVHSGDMSFVIWVKIPYSLEEEMTVFNVPDKDNKTSCFDLINITNTGVRIQTLKIDKNYEGMLLMFPSHTPHCVYPFYTSDEYRISVAGNLKKR